MTPGPKCCSDGNCASYRGNLNTTDEGLPCLPWSKLKTHTKYLPSKRPESGLDLNYCRNPSKHSQAWCYVMENGKEKWKNCNMHPCAPTATTTMTPGPKCCSDGNCASYRGNLNTTDEGLPCLPWSKLKTHTKYLPSKRPKSGLDLNYCRNP